MKEPKAVLVGALNRLEAQKEKLLEQLERNTRHILDIQGEIKRMEYQVENLREESEMIRDSITLREESINRQREAIESIDDIAEAREQA